MNDMQTTGRERALLSRGYTQEDILRFSRTPRKTVEDAAQRIFARLTRFVEPSESPVCVFVGAQPGGGKSTRIRGVKSTAQGDDFIVLAMDDYRSFHPLYAELENLILQHWQNREETGDDSPGSDIADFTQLFAGDVVDLLEEMASGATGGPKYSILYEWAMRASVEPLNAMRRLKGRGYRNEVTFVAVNAQISLEACRQRSRVMNSKGRLIRAIPDSFHDLSVKRLPFAINEIYRIGVVEEGIVDAFVITNRNGTVLWIDGEENAPGDVFLDYLTNGPLDEANSADISEEAFEQESQGFAQ